MANSFFVNSKNLWTEAKDFIDFIKTSPLAKGFTEDNLWHIVFAAKNLNLPIDIALKGFYVVAGKIEMTSALMAQIIRAHGHSIIRQESSEKLCVLKGIRKDNGNTWMSSFSLQDAVRAGLYDEKRINVWRKFPQRMLFARALSILARDLFSDILAGFYVEGELSSEQETETVPDPLLPVCEWVETPSPHIITHTSPQEEKEETHEPKS